METPTIEQLIGCSYGRNNKSLSFTWTLAGGARWVVVGGKKQVAQFDADEFEKALELYNKV